MRKYRSVGEAGADNRASASQLPGEDSAFTLRTVWRVRPVRLIIYVGLLLVVAIATAGSFAIASLRNNMLADSERELGNLATVLAEHVERTFETLTLTQLGFAQQVQALDILSLDDFEQRLSGPDIHLLLKDRINNLRSVRALMLASSRGKIINDTREWPSRGGDISEQDYFKVLRFNAGPSTAISAPMQSSSGEGWIFHIAYNIVDPEQKVIGVIIGVLELRYFEQLFGQVIFGKGSSISLTRRDGRVLARYPAVDMRVAPSFGTSPLFTEVLPRAGKGVIRVTSHLNDQERLIAGQNLANHQATVTVGMDVDSALRGWRSGALQMVVISSLMMVVFGTVIFLCAWHVARNMAKQKLRLDTALNNMSQGLCMFDGEKRLVLCNGQYATMYGLSREQMREGTPLRNILEYRVATGNSPEDTAQYIEDRLAEVSRSVPYHAVNKLRDGRYIAVVHQPMPAGGWVALHQDITEQKRAEEQIAHLAHHDGLTDLPNRVLLSERLEAALSRLRSDECLAVHYLDLDLFKNVNDTLGHAVGDELLRAVAERLQSLVRESDIIARLGGDEFAIVQTGLRRDADAAMLAQRIRNGFQSPYALKEHQIVTDVSIGIAVAPADGEDADKLLRHADLALYAAKADGRATHRFFEPQMDGRLKERRAVEVALRAALVNGEFELHYQPVVNLARGEISGCEALLRWRHPQRGMILPSEFIPVAEETGLINQIGEWVLKTACADAAAWPDEVRAISSADRASRRISRSGWAPAASAWKR
jgi:diguanylate cyclase (GGDEF)-like protein/PAS domain S-box-containing protein